LKRGSKIALFILIVVLLKPLDVLASGSYRPILKKWTRHQRIYVVDNFEARLLWHATYFSKEFRDTYFQRLNDFMQGPPEEGLKRKKLNDEDAQKFDVFFVSIYSGSSAWPEIGDNSAQWKFILETSHGKKVFEKVSEKIRVTEVERHMFPYLDRWSQGFWVKFPKTILPEESFRLKISGMPVRSELKWDGVTE